MPKVSLIHDFLNFEVKEEDIARLQKMTPYSECGQAFLSYKLLDEHQEICKYCQNAIERKKNHG